MEPLRERCRVAGVIQDAIAAEYGCTRPFVVNVFAGRKSPPDGFIAAVERLCKARERRRKVSA